MDLNRQNAVLLFCIMFTILCVIISNITSSKLLDLQIFGTTIIIPAGTPIFCLAFLATDIISEIWGRKMALYTTFLAVVARLIAISYIVLTLQIPGADHWPHQEAYEQIFSGSLRALIAGVFAFIVASVLDAYIFHYLRERHKGKNLLFFRNLTSTFIAQIFGGFTFVCLAFYGRVPEEKLLFILMVNILLKWFVALIDTPFVYMARNYTLHRPLFDFKG